VGSTYIDAEVAVPHAALGLVLFVHGSGSSRHSPRNQFVAEQLRAQGLGTVLMDLLTPSEERADQFSGHLRFNIPFLAGRVSSVVDELRPQTGLPFGLFGASTGAAAALVVAARRPKDISAVVSRGGRPDLAGDALATVSGPILLIVGGDDHDVLGLNRDAMGRMKADVRLEIVPGASHLFQEPGALETVAHLAADWFTQHLDRAAPA
jgi:pimeloyl-ACP methyl ester carboxylesterase